MEDADKGAVQVTAGGTKHTKLASAMRTSGAVGRRNPLARLRVKALMAVDNDDNALERVRNRRDPALAVEARMKEYQDARGLMRRHLTEALAELDMERPHTLARKFAALDARVDASGGAERQLPALRIVAETQRRKALAAAAKQGVWYTAMVRRAVNDARLEDGSIGPVHAAVRYVLDFVRHAISVGSHLDAEAFVEVLSTLSAAELARPDVAHMIYFLKKHVGCPKAVMEESLAERGLAMPQIPALISLGGMGPTPDPSRPPTAEEEAEQEQREAAIAGGSAVGTKVGTRSGSAVSGSGSGAAAAPAAEHAHVAPDATGHEAYDVYYVLTHKQLSVAYNGDRIIEVNLTSDQPREVKPGAPLAFSYSVSWTETSKRFEDRFRRYLDASFFEHQIHWFSLFNSFMMVVFLCGVVALILLKVLRNDYAKYMRDEEDLDDSEKGMGDESGWKLVHGDVFRRPDHLALFAALTGTGYQLAFLVAAVVLVALMGSLYVDRGAITTVSIVAYALTSVVSGYASGSYYRAHFYPNPSPGWIKTMLLTALLCPFTVFAVIFALNFVAIAYSTVNAIPFATMVSVFLIWAFVSVPLVVAGTYLGRHLGGHASWPCRVNHIPHPIPPRRWFFSPVVVCLATGVLPFGSIFIEMYYVFTSFWNYKFYYVYGFMLLVYTILVIVIACVTIVSTYLLLNSEDWRWPWLSFLSAASTALYVFAYAVYYFIAKTNMSGFLQTAFYFGYMGLFSLALAVLCGTIGFAAASTFVRRIYRNIKID
uniref:Transmembrane 9 superfamily member n=1 Tax=Bicosoecida sp. CB-2014 TaxID=1486930 RepID=A0A7S1C7F8_9STRA